LGDKPCIVVPEGPTVTYGALDRSASVFAEQLMEAGVRPGDRLVLANYNTPEFFIALFGASRAGAIAVPVDPGLAALELRNVINHVAPHAVVVDHRHAGTFLPLGVPLYGFSDVPGVKTCDLARTPSQTALGSRPGGRQPAMILYTSGTTGSPRGAVYSHGGMLQKVSDIVAWFGLDETYRSLCLLPTHFGHGLVANCLTTFRAMGTLVLCQPFDVELLSRLSSILEDHRIQAFSTVPTMVRLILRRAAASPPPRSTHLRFVTCASAPLHPEEVLAFESRFGVPLLNCYGITEAGTWSAMSPRDDSRDRRSVGMAFGCRIRAVDQEGAALPDGEIGELQISGPSVMLEYYRDPAATAAALRDGWLSTGDLGRVDAEGRVFIAGRSKTMIIRAGANIYPSEVEGILLTHPQVAEAHVVGLEHPIYGEQVAACIVRKPGTSVSVAELLDHCRGRLSEYKWPQQFRFVEEVPKTSRGKVNQAKLKELFATSPAARAKA
jgi:long-chain acyl-CoA synthetase